MSQFPSALDSDTDLPAVNDNITEIGGDAINAIRAALMAVESEIGIINPADGYGASGSTGSIAQRLGVSIFANGKINPAALIGIGLIALPITDSQISPTAAIQESKLNLQYTTSSLYTLYTTLKNAVDIVNNFISITGVKVEPHIAGSDFNHLLSAIRIDTSPVLQNKNLINRNTTNADTLVSDINFDLVAHERADGSTVSSTLGVISGGTTPPTNLAHNASGIAIDSSGFSIISQTSNTLQKFANFVDNSSLFLLGSRTQNLFSNGVSRSARSSSLSSDGYGQSVVPVTAVNTYLLNSSATAPVDDITTGDDIVVFTPSAGVLSSFVFYAQFAQIKPGDIITINYGTGVSVQFPIDSVKNVGTGLFAVRINGKNLAQTSGIAFARIDRPAFNENKYAVVAVAEANNTFNQQPSLIVVNPKSALALGIGFDPSKFDSTHYNLYLTLYPSGNPNEKFITFPTPIDVTGNAGTTPGKYTLSYIIKTTNAAFRANGFNHRFVAFDYNGQFGISLADPYNNASFSIVSGVVNTLGNYFSGSNSSFPSNVVDNFNNIDPLGFGFGGANAASPSFAVSYATKNAAIFAPTILFVPLKKNFFYVNGVEKDRLKSDPILINQNQDVYGDGFWTATITGKQIFSDRVSVTYTLNFDLSTSGIKAGKTIVVQPAISVTDSSYLPQDYGRFTMTQVAFSCCPVGSTTITVHDAVSGTGISPYLSSAIGTVVRIYFSDDSVSYDLNNVEDSSPSGLYKRSFEVLIDQTGHTMMHERARFLNDGSAVANINMYKISPKLRGYATGSPNQKSIRLSLTGTSTTSVTGIYSGFLERAGTTNLGPVTSGKKGEVVRFYDETNIDFIDFVFDINDAIIVGTQTLDIELFKPLSTDDEFMLLSSCQVNDSTNIINYTKDERQFGNVSEKHLSTSAIDFIAANSRLSDENGIFSGFSLAGEVTSTTLTNSNAVAISGGKALINGKIINMNDGVAYIPKIIENSFGVLTTTWFLCVNEKSEYEFIASTDYDLSLSGTYTTFDHNRIFYALNQNSPSTPAYAIRSTYLSNLILKYRDLVPLYVVRATVGLVSLNYIVTSATVTDARRFISNGYGSLENPFVLSADGSFRNFVSLNTWLTQLTGLKSYNSLGTDKIGTIVLVKDNIDVSGLTLSFLEKIKFVGDGGRFTSNSTTNFTNIKLDNLIFDMNATVNMTNVDIDNSTLNVNSTTSMTRVKLDNSTCNITSTTGLQLHSSNTICECNINYTGSAGAVTLLSFVDGYSVVTENNFNRNGTSISFYIASASTLSHIVTDNIFDSPTTDGSNDFITQGLDRSLYERNRNQTSYKEIPFCSFNRLFSPDTINPTFTVVFPDTADAVYLLSHTTISGSGVAQTYYVRICFPIDDFLPQGTKILIVKGGIWLSNTGFGLPTPDTTGNSYQISLIAKDVGTNNFATGTNSILDPANKNGVGLTVAFDAVTFNTSIAAIAAATQYAAPDVSNILQFKVNDNTSIICNVELSVNYTAANGDLIMSPVVVKYRW